MKKPWNYIFIGFFVFAFIVSAASDDSPLMTVASTGMLVSGVVGYIKNKDVRAAKKAAKAERRAEKRRVAQEKYNSPEEVERRRKVAEERKRREDDKRAVSAVLIATDSRKSGVGAAGRAVVGGALLGPVGAVAGAASGTSKAKRATFSVKYASGRTGTETVEIGSRRFNELSGLLHK